MIQWNQELIHIGSNDRTTIYILEIYAIASRKAAEDTWDIQHIFVTTAKHSQ